MDAFKPKAYFKRVSQIPFSLLMSWGIKAVFLDTDNTLAPRDSDAFAKDALAWVEACKRAGFLLCIVSNGRPGRVRRASEKLGVPFVNPALKPFSYGFKKAARMMKVSSKQCVMIGDQIFTDIWGGNNSGMKTILVEPVDPKSDGLWTKWIRKLEKRHLGLSPEGL